MKAIKGVLFVLAGLFLMVTAISLLMPSTVTTIRGMPVHASEEKIVAEISDLKEFKKWHPVFMHDSAAIYSEPSTGVNASVQWITGGKTNTIRITEQSPAGIKFMLIRPGENDVENILSVAPLQDSTGFQVQWQALTKLKWYPWEKFAGIFTDKMTGPGYEVALQNLKRLLEN
jgi:hypothetical protein